MCSPLGGRAVGAGHRSSSRDPVNYFGTGLILPFEIIYQAGRPITIIPHRGSPVTSRIGYYSDDDFEDDEDPDEL